MLEEIIDRRNIEKALFQVERNKGVGGVDGRPMNFETTFTRTTKRCVKA